MKTKDQLQLWGILVVLVAINLLAGYWKGNIDLTQDKRFTLSEYTQTLLDDLDEPVTITIYLEPDLNSGFRRLYQAVELLVDQMRRNNRKNIHVEFVQVDKLSNAERKKFNAMVKEHNMLPVNVVDEDNSGKMTQKSIYPWAMVQSKKAEMPVELLMNLGGRSGEENLNTSIENLEYHLVDALRILTGNDSGRIAFLEGHGEWDEDAVYDLTQALSRYFSIDRGRIGSTVDMLKPYKALVIAGPVQPFTEAEKFILDQYLMAGGKVLWMVDGVRISADSLQNAEATMGMYNEINISDLLFSYGVRINPVLVKDMQCTRMPVNIAPEGASPDFKPMPWYYSPLFTASNRHPVSRNISPVKGDFASTIDVVSAQPEVQKSVILATGRQTAVENTPAWVSLQQLTQEVDPKEFSHQYLPVAAILEGKFSSAWLNRMPPKGVDIQPNEILSQSKPTSMMVIADGDVARNEVQYIGTGKRIFPLGFDKLSGSVQYGNKNFLLNAINYLTDEQGVIGLRNRSIPLRLLDKEQANSKRYVWQIINFAVPLGLLVLVALINLWVRKKRYGAVR